MRQGNLCRFSCLTSYVAGAHACPPKAQSISRKPPLSPPFTGRFFWGKELAGECHAERREESLVAGRFFAALSMTDETSVLPKPTRESLSPQVPWGRVEGPYLAFTMVLRNRPMPSISVSMTSPAWRNSGGLRAKPTPLGVPVAIISPASRVMPVESKAIVWATE